MKLQNQVIKVYTGVHGYFTRLVRHDELKNEWQTAFLYLQFRRGEVVQDKTSIEIKDGRLSFYISKEGKVVLYIFIKEYEIVSND